nr:MULTISPECIES: 4-oxalocrotonate tautomerase [unclassified Herbaspirillum]
MATSLSTIKNLKVGNASNYCIFISSQKYATLQPLRRQPDGSLTKEKPMPIIHVEMFAGRTLEQKRAFVSEVTRVASETLACPPESVDVLFTEFARENWAKAGKLVADK